MTNQDLLPCPFCGSTNIDVLEGSTFRWAFAECIDCGARSGEIRVQTSGVGTIDEWKKEAQVKALNEWNQRYSA